MRSRRGLAALVAAIAVMIGLPPLPAHADGAPVVRAAWSTREDPDTLRISATAASGIAGFRANIVARQTGDVVASIGAFTLESGTAQDGIWATAQPVRLPELGVYGIDVEATDAAGQTVQRKNAGELIYHVLTFFEGYKLDRTSVDFHHRSIAVQGRLKGRWPGTREVKPLAGETVQVGRSVLDAVQLTTGADGSFVGSLAIAEPITINALYHGEYGKFYWAQTDDTEIRVLSLPTKLSVNLNKTRLNAGEPITISGILTGKAPGHRREPLSNRSVWATVCWEENSCQFLDASADTDANGWYELTLIPYRSGYVKVGHGSDDPFVSSAGARSRQVVVLQLSEIREFWVVRRGGKVEVSGTIDFTSGFSPAVTPIQVQFSANGETGWSTVATLEVGGGQGPFSTVVSNRRGGYWRAYYAGRPDFFASSVSASQRLEGAVLS